MEIRPKASLCLSLGDGLRDQGRQEKVLAKRQEAITEYPFLPLINFLAYIGRVLEALGLYKRAESADGSETHKAEILERLYHINLTCAMLPKFRGMRDEQKKHLEEALLNAKKFQLLEPVNVVPFFLIATVSLNIKISS